MKNPSPDVAVLVPVLGRPHHVRRLLDDVKAATPEPYRLLFIADESDEAELKELRGCRANFITVDDETPWGVKVNEGIDRTESEWILAGADDLHFHPDWFSRALRWAKDDTAVIGTNDMCNPRVMRGEHSTHMLIRRTYVEELGGTVDGGPGLAFHPGYRHEYADDELVETAQYRGVYAHAFDALVEHLHPMNGKAEDDSTYQLGRRHTMESKRLFRQRARLWRSA